MSGRHVGNRPSGVRQAMVQRGRSGRDPRGIGAYKIEIVTTFEVLVSPMKTLTGIFPGDAVSGIVTLSCNTPETSPGASRTGQQLTSPEIALSVHCHLH